MHHQTKPRNIQCLTTKSDASWCLTQQKSNIWPIPMVVGSFAHHSTGQIIGERENQPENPMVCLHGKHHGFAEICFIKICDIRCETAGSLMARWPGRTVHRDGAVAHSQRARLGSCGGSRDGKSWRIYHGLPSIFHPKMGNLETWCSRLP